MVQPGRRERWGLSFPDAVMSCVQSSSAFFSLFLFLSDRLSNRIFVKRLSISTCFHIFPQQLGFRMLMYRSASSNDDLQKMICYFEYKTTGAVVLRYFPSKECRNRSYKKRLWVKILSEKMRSVFCLILCFAIFDNT